MRALCPCIRGATCAMGGGLFDGAVSRLTHLVANDASPIPTDSIIYRSDTAYKLPGPARQGRASIHRSCSWNHYVGIDVQGRDGRPTDERWSLDPTLVFWNLNRGAGGVRRLGTAPCGDPGGRGVAGSLNPRRATLPGTGKLAKTAGRGSAGPLRRSSPASGALRADTTPWSLADTS